MTHALISRRAMLVTSAWLPLAACSVLPDPPAPQMYRLSPQTKDPVGAIALPGRLVVDTPSAPQNLDSDRIAIFRGATRFDYYADSVWTSRVPLLLQDLVVGAFQDDGRIADVGRDMDDLGSTYLLKIDIRDFEACYGNSGLPPEIVVSLDLDLLRMQGHHNIGHTVITERATAARNKLHDVVQAFNAATAAALQQSVAWTCSKMRVQQVVR